MLLKQIRRLHGLKHVGRESVGAQADGHAAAQHLGNGRATHCVGHIGFRIVHDIGPGIAQQMDLALVDVNAVRGKGPLAEDPEIVPAFDDALPVLAQAMIHIEKRLGGMHMKAGVAGGGSLAASQQCFVAQRKGCMETEEPAESAALRLSVTLDERAVLFNSLRGDLGAVAVGDFIT